MKTSRLYTRLKPQLEDAVARNDFPQICSLMKHVLFAARYHNDLKIATQDWVRRGLVALAHGPTHGNPLHQDACTDVFYPCSEDDADKMSNYVSLVMIMIYLDVEHKGSPTDPHDRKLRLVLHQIFGSSPCWMRFRSVCFRLLFAKSQLTEGFLYTGELFLIMANYQKLNCLTLTKLKCPNEHACEHRCEAIMHLGEYIEFAKRFVSEGGKSGVGLVVLKTLVDYADQFIAIYEKAQRKHQSKSQPVAPPPRTGLNTLRQDILDSANDALKTCNEIRQTLVQTGGQMAVRAIPVRKQQAHPRERTAAEKQHSQDVKDVVREINRRYEAPGNKQSIPKIIQNMRKASAYVARMRGISDATLKRYANEARRLHRLPPASVSAQLR